LKHSVIAIFDNRDLAKEASAALIQNGFSRKEVVLALPEGDMGMDFGGLQANIHTEGIGSEETERFTLPAVAIQSGSQATSPVTLNGLFAMFSGPEDGGEGTEDFPDLESLVKEQLKPNGAMVVVHPSPEHSIAAFEILNSYGGHMMDSTRPEEKALYEGYNLKQIPVGEIFEDQQPTQDATEGGNFRDTQRLKDETIPIPAHIISEYGFIDPNIGPGNKDLLFNEFAEDTGPFDPETRDELAEEMIEEQEMQDE
jgi:hypothetical protein